MEKKAKFRNIAIFIVIVLIVGIIFFYQMQKKGFHEDEVYTIGSSVNPYDGLISPYDNKDVHTKMWEKYIFDDSFFVEVKNAINYVKNQEAYRDEMDELDRAKVPEWKVREDVINYMTLTQDNYLNLKSIYYNQVKDTHPPFFYTLVHFSSILFGGEFSKYTVFLVNIVAFILSCIVIKKVLKILNKEHLIIGILIFYGLSMGTITMVLYQRMYMVLTLFILLYFYYNIKLYQNEFVLSRELIVKLGIVTILGFLTQYYFAIFAALILIIVIIQMIVNKKYKTMFKYIGFHILYAIIGILIFVPCMYHLLFNERGISNISTGHYLEYLIEYIKHILYIFTIKDNNILTIAIIGIFIGGLIYSLITSKEKFVIFLSIVPSIIYLFIVIKLTSFRELRYIMPMIPFVSITLFLILDNVIKIKFKELIIVVIATVLVIPGFIFSKPKLLFEEYEECLQIAEENKDKSFVYIYDNGFNHAQSIPEMMIYEKTMIINVNNNELQYVINNEQLNQENSYILSIKVYMNNEEIIQEIVNNTEFQTVTKLFEGVSSSEVVSNNLYLVSK